MGKHTTIIDSTTRSRHRQPLSTHIIKSKPLVAVVVAVISRLFALRLAIIFDALFVQTLGGLVIAQFLFRAVAALIQRIRGKFE